MDETTGKMAACMAITEKRAHRPGGCVGIFFQLFDWNRRFAKKKLFSKKLLPPARAKQASKKFGGDEKMPKTKLHLIADENSGGFPNVKKNVNRTSVDIMEQKHDMRAPGLVARLMGLESLPAMYREKHKKTSNSVTCGVKEEKIVNTHNESDRRDLNLEKVNTKVDSRPQKLQKTGEFERRPVTRFGAEALQIRSVLSRSRKHHPPKLVSPVKSPRISSSRNPSRASRLIDAAARILEPGLHATNRAKCALAYPSSMSYAPKDEVFIEGMGVRSPGIVNQQQNNASYNVGACKSFMGQTSCKNCGNLLDVVDCRPNMEEKTFVCPSPASNLVNASSPGSERVNASSPGSERIEPRQPILSSEQKRDVSYQRNHVQLPIAADKQDNTHAYSDPTTDCKSVLREGQAPRQLSSQQCGPIKDGSSSVGFKQRRQSQKEMSIGRGRITPRAKSSNLQSRRAFSAANAISGEKDFVALNRSLTGRTESRVSTKIVSTTTNLNRKVFSRQDDSLSQLRSPVRKRRTVSVNPQIGSAGFSNSMSMRQRNVQGGVMNGKEFQLSSRSIDRPFIKSRSGSEGSSNIANGIKDNDVISFTFRSPMRQETFISMGLKEGEDQIDDESSQQRKLVYENDGKTYLRKQLPLRGDALGVLLEQKLKELISQEEEEFTIGGIPPKRSTAMILQELISALTAEQNIPPDGHGFDADAPSLTKKEMGGTSVGYDGDHLSPGSVLEASFSNESCFSSSLDDNSGRRLLPDFMDYSYDRRQPMENNADLMDSATSMNGARTGSKTGTDLLNHISMILQSINLASGGLTGCKLAHAKEVIFNAELLFRNATLHDSDRMKSLLIGPFLLDELETVAVAIRTNSNCLGFEESKEGDQLRRLLFDCVIECLDWKYVQFSNCGFEAWRRVPPCMNAKRLIQEVGEEVSRWTGMAVMSTDEIAEWEMSHSLGKWVDFEIEAFGAGAEIDRDILQILVEEIVVDLWESRLVSF